MKSKQVLSIEQKVFIGNKGKRTIEAEIIGICIRSNSVKYEVAWWKDDTRKTEWLFEEELSLEGDVTKTKLGFK